MHHIHALVRRPAVKSEAVVETISLPHHARMVAHAHFQAAALGELCVHFDKMTQLKDGDALKLDDGRLVRIKAAEERLIQAKSDNPVRLLRLAFNLGSSHVPVELAQDALYMPSEPHVLELARNMGLEVVEVQRAFEPEAAVHLCDHDHHHDHGHHHHDHGHHHHGHDHDHHHHGHDHHHEHKHG